MEIEKSNIQIMLLLLIIALNPIATVLGSSPSKFE